MANTSTGVAELIPNASVKHGRIRWVNAADWAANNLLAASEPNSIVLEPTITAEDREWRSTTGRSPTWFYHRPVQRAATRCYKFHKLHNLCQFMQVCQQLQLLDTDRAIGAIIETGLEGVGEWWHLDIDWQNLSTFSQIGSKFVKVADKCQS